nr:OmpA family protein [Bacteroidales bacterium]
AAGYLSKEAAEELAKEYAKNHPVVKTEVKTETVVKEVEKIVNKEIPSSTAVFFSKGQATLTQADKARLNLFAEGIKSVDSSFTINGYADKKTGSAKTNQNLSEKRAQAVLDYLVSQGVPASKLSINANGGVDPIFFNNDALSRTVIIKTK